MLTVGQELWFVFSGNHSRRESHATTVKKVGRKWAALSNGYRIDVQSLQADGAGYNSPGRAYPDRNAYEAEAERQRLWSVLRRRIDQTYRVPDGVTAEQIKIAAASIGLLDANEMKAETPTE